jgi:twitching motility protein PilT
MNYEIELKNIIDILVKEGGSDLHFSVGSPVTARINTELISFVNRPPLTREDTAGFVRAMVSEQEYADFLEKQEIDFSYEVNGLRIRGNGFFQKGSIGIALRLLPAIRDIKELSLPPIIETFARKEQGFFLVVGPVGQGKSTTLAAMVNLINQEMRKYVITIEDPIEFIYPKGKSTIDQREVGIDTKSFEAALKGAFREDIDVILIGEMRNKETIATAITAAETGHLVFSTLHTNSASQTIDRIVDTFPGEQQGQIRIQLANSLLGIFSQRLIPRISGGLVPAFELLINNSAVANLIRENRTHEIDMVIETGTELGMIDLNRSLLDLVRRGEITMENAYTYSNNPRSLERLMQ